MEFRTQYSERIKSVGERTGSDTPVVQTTIRGNSEKLAQMVLAGQYVEAARVGYEYGPDDKIPSEILTRPGRSADIVDVLAYTEEFGKRIRAQMRNIQKEAESERQDSGVPQENGSGSKGAKETTGSGDGTLPDKGN